MASTKWMPCAVEGPDTSTQHQQPQQEFPPLLRFFRGGIRSDLFLGGAALQRCDKASLKFNLVIPNRAEGPVRNLLLTLLAARKTARKPGRARVPLFEPALSAAEGCLNQNQKKEPGFSPRGARGYPTCSAKLVFIHRHQRGKLGK